MEKPDCPVEVKAGKSGALKSLQQFIHQRQSTLAVRFDLNPPSLQEISCLTTTANGSVKVKFPLLSLPLYAVDELARVISQSITP